MAVNVPALVPRPLPRLGRLAIAGGLAATAAATANLALFLAVKHVAGVSFVMPYQGAGGPPAPLPVGMVVIASALPALAAAALLGLLARLVARPWRTFRAVAVVVALLSLGGPLSLAGVGLDTRLALVALHLLAAAVIVGVLSALTPGRLGADRPGS